MTDFSSLLPIEADYAAWMRDTAEPFLAARRVEGFFSSFDGKKIRYEYETADQARGAVVIAHGFTESAEKFREMAYWFLQMGYSVFAVDHRGHGRSFRLSEDFAMTDVGHFSDYVTDFVTFTETVVKPNTGSLPLYLYGHSMGGAISVLTLQEHPDLFTRAILTAPMLKPKTANFPTVLSRMLSGFFRGIGLGKGRVFTYAAGFNKNETFEASPDTSRERFEYYRQKRVKYPYLQNTYPSYRWLNESLRIVGKMLDPKRCAKVRLPVLLFSAGDDAFVFREEQERFISRIDRGRIVYEERARHEIYMSTNDVMVDYLGEIEKFLSEDS